MNHEVSLAVLLLLGGAHGLNPAMGWLFAVSLGLQEGSGRAVWQALVPLAVGHALAIGATLVAAAVLGMALPLKWIRWIAAAALLGFGLWHLVRHRHPRWGGMRVGARDLAIWSFIMASAHGAGLMALPFVLGPSAERDAVQAGHTGHLGGLVTPGPAGGDPVGLLAAMFHTSGYLLVTGVVAVVVYYKLGLRLLRTAWINLDLIWALALILTALVTPFEALSTLGGSASAVPR